MKGHLRVSELFFSIQGEGPTSGKPAVFLRLGGCNLLCGGPKAAMPGHPKTDGATWTCDTIDVWRKSNWTPTAEVAKRIAALVTDFDKDRIALVITGGEPLMHENRLDQEFFELVSTLEQFGLIFDYEVETNGTYVPSEEISEFVPVQWNVSPKLASSGMPRERRWLPSVLDNFVQRGIDGDEVVFKFVVATDDDIEEVTKFLLHYPVNRRSVWLMPAAETREELISAGPWVVEKCKLLGCNFSSRQHIMLWNKKTGV